MLIATGCSELIKLHYWPTCEHIKTFNLPYSGYSVSSISWCIDGETVAHSTSSKTPPILFSTRSDDEEIPQEIFLPNIATLCFSTTRRTAIALGAESGNVMLYDIQNHKITRNLPALPSSVQFLRYGAKDAMLAAGCTNGLICIYNPEYNVKSTFYMPETDRPLSAMACHSELSNLLGGASADGIVAVWDTTSGHCLFKNKVHVGAVTGIAFPAQAEIASVGTDCNFKCYDVRREGPVFSVKADCKLTDVDFMSSDGVYIAVTTIDGKIYCYDKRHIAHPLNTIIAHHPKPIAKIAFQPLPSNDISSNSIDLSFTPANIRLNSEFDIQHFYSRNRHAAPYALVGQDCLYKPQEEESDISVCNSLYEKNVFPHKSTEENVNTSTIRSEADIDLGTPIIKVPFENFLKKDAVASLTEELKTFTDDIINKLVEYVDEEFLRIRLVVGKGFVDLEGHINSRWNGFGSSFLQYAAGDVGIDLGSESGITLQEPETSTVTDRGSSMWINNKSSYQRFNKEH